MTSPAIQWFITFYFLNFQEKLRKRLYAAGKADSEIPLVFESFQYTFLHGPALAESSKSNGGGSAPLARQAGALKNLKRSIRSHAVLIAIGVEWDGQLSLRNVLSTKEAHSKEIHHPFVLLTTM